jgi:pimeloyl-ACP methyl ester carboxylesterase
MRSWGTPVPTATVEQVVSGDGTPIACWTSGEGPPLVIVHGSIADHTSAAAVVPLLEPSFTVTVVDRRGRGSSGDAEGYAVEREFADVVAVVDAVAARSGRQVVLYGHSYGATCALGAAPLTPHLAGLVLYEPAFGGFGIVTDGLVHRLEALAASGAHAEAVALALREAVGASEEQLAAMRALPSWPSRVAAAHTIPRELRVAQTHPFDPHRYAAMATPTLLLAGERSPAGYRALVEVLTAGLPRVEVAVLADQGHTAQIAAPQLVADALTRFLTH